ncbi:hypothetical protein [Spiroplasma endosymbiont of Nebria brevicollis]|uniref:hypothetical protein n=1 Tax=Spiroplasma endosymbiont of Nebria brevicollis TaxID=3066284 RepID=UPI00313D1BF5
MIIEFSQEQIIKETDNGAIIIEFGEYKISISKCFIKKNSFNIDETRIYWVFKDNIKKELNGVQLKELLKQYIQIEDLKEKPIIYNKIIEKLITLEFYKKYNGYYIGQIKNEECFKYNITWEKDRKSFKINNPYNHNDLVINYIVTSLKDLVTHNNKIFYLKY